MIINLGVGITLIAGNVVESSNANTIPKIRRTSMYLQYIATAAAAPLFGVCAKKMPRLVLVLG